MCQTIIWKFALIKLPEKHFRRNRIAIEFFMGVATDIHCSKTLYRLGESLLEKILMWQRRKKRVSDQPIDPFYTHSHALSRRQPRCISGWTKSRCDAPWWRKKCGRTGVSDLALLPTFLQISPSYTYTLAQTLPESHPHRCKYFTSPTEAEEELYCFVQGDVVLEPTGVGFSRAPAPSISSEQLQVGSPQVNTSTSTCV